MTSDQIGDSIDAWTEKTPSERRDAMRAAWADGLKDWWEKALQDQKDKLNDIIPPLKNPISRKARRGQKSKRGGISSAIRKRRTQ